MDDTKLDADRIFAGDADALVTLSTFVLASSIEGVVTAADTPAGPDLATRLGEFLPAMEAGALADQLIGLQPLNKHDLALLLLVDRWFRHFRQQSDIEPELQAAICRWQLPVSRVVLQDPSCLSFSDHPLRQLLDAMAEHALGWSVTLGRSGRNYQQQLNQLSQLVVSAVRIDNVRIDQWQRQYEQIWRSARQSADRFEQRLLQSEQGALRAAKAEREVVRQLNRLLLGRRLPPFVNFFITEHWRPSLQLLLVEQGVSGAHWQEAIELSDALVKATSPYQEGARDQWFEILAQLPDRLPPLLASLRHQPHEVEDLMASFSELCIQIMTADQEVERQPMEPMVISGDVIPVAASVSLDLVRKVDALKEGQWFLYRRELEPSVRCKLLLRLDELGQLLFVSFSGVKVFQKSADEIAYLLAAGLLQPLSHQMTFSLAYSQVLRELMGEYEASWNKREAARKRAAVLEKQLRDKRERQAKLAAAKRQAEEKARAIARQKAEAEAKALREAQRVAQVKAEQEAKQLADLQAQEDAKAREKARLEASQLVDSLNLGAWFEVRDRLGTKQKCKLAVKMVTIGKYMFADRVGIKVAELHRDELIDGLVEGTVVFLDKGHEFEDTLAKVVNDLRRQHTPTSN